LNEERAQQRRNARREVVCAALALAWVYLLTFADRHFGWWPSIGLDFSTHTGVALVIVITLGRRWRRLRPLLAVLMLGYAAWMVMRGYHTALDILTTALVVAPVALIVGKRT
jgi:hypothetical protein